MGQKVSEETKKEEAKRLSELITLRWKGSLASFAAAAGVARADLNQHLNLNRPIPMKAAKSYAKILNCGLEEISPRWAAELLSGHDKDHVTEFVDPLITEVISNMKKMSHPGKLRLAGMATTLAAQFPLLKQTPKSSR